MVEGSIPNDSEDGSESMPAGDVTRAAEHASDNDEAEVSMMISNFLHILGGH